jgi:hypothetical protein
LPCWGSGASSKPHERLPKPVRLASSSWALDD